ncbi:hypothetical protein HX035_24465, partial [Escherichia coli]
MNVISYEAFKALKKGFCKSSTTLTSFSNSSTEVLGKTSLTLCHEGFKDESTFYIAEPGKATQSAILGRTWMRKNKCSIDWEANKVHLGSKDSQITLPLVTTEENFQEKLPSNNQQPQAPATPRQLFERGTNDQEASTSQAHIV